MLKTYTAYLANKLIKNLYETNDVTYGLIRKLLSSYDGNEKPIIEEFVNHLNSLKRIDTMPVNTHKIDYITDSIGIKPTNVLDIGAGKGIILSGVKQFYGLSTENVYALDLQPIERKDITVIGYDENMKIPLEDNSIDLIIMLSLLHHVEDRKQLLLEVVRVLSPNGRVIIREHDDDKTKLFYIFIQLMHYVWYEYNNESRDPLVMMSHKELISLFKSVGLTSVNYIKPVGFNIQKLYGEVFKKIN